MQSFLGKDEHQSNQGHQTENHLFKALLMDAQT